MKKTNRACLIAILVFFSSALTFAKGRFNDSAVKPAIGSFGTHLKKAKTVAKPVTTGAERTDAYLGLLKGKTIGMVINQTSVMGKKLTPTLDSLISLGIQVKKIFGPEHGFRGTASDGAKVDDSKDAKTGIPAISLYGKHYKPTPEDLKGIDLMIFDIQDVGARFYTYISTLHYVMEACAENHIELMIWDRPNPNGSYVDGPILDTAYHSFVGMHPIPMVHGMTIAEYAQMINGEGWLKNKVKCRLKIIKMENYTHTTPYVLPIKPSPNLSTRQSVLLYPSLCLFEGTAASVGRGTVFPFQVIGHPSLSGLYTFSFTPVSVPGVSDNPPLKGQLCYGLDLHKYPAANLKQINLGWLIELYKAFPDKGKFFNAYFIKLAGGKELQKQIEEGKMEKKIRLSWQPGLSRFRKMRERYLIY